VQKIAPLGDRVYPLFLAVEKDEPERALVVVSRWNEREWVETEGVVRWPARSLRWVTLRLTWALPRSLLA
jgi:hypothetical protein